MEKILQYQELDQNLQQLEKQIANSEEKVIMNKMIAFVKDAQNKSLELENQAKKLTDEYLTLKKEYDKNIALIKELTSKKAEELSTNQMEEIFNQINLVSSNLFMIERNLNIGLVNIKNLLKEFETTKNSVIKAREKHRESKEKYEAFVNELTPKINKIKGEMAKLKKTISPELMTKYKAIKHDNVFPVFVPVVNDNCGGCRMALPMGMLNKIKNEKYIVCEQCGRIIYS